MFDDLRNDAEKQFEEEAQYEYQFEEPQKGAAGGATSKAKQRPSKPFLGLSSMQRFVLAFLIMMATCLLGFLCLFATGKVLLF